LGGVRIGNNCRVGAMSVVLHDMPDGSTAVGAPARLITLTDTERTTADHVHSAH
jgi:serine O-acetyltransferase